MTKSGQEMTKEPFILRKGFLGAIAGILLANFVVSIGLYFTKFHHGLSDNQETWGQYGDLFGGILNPTLSFLALMGLIITIKLQVKGLATSQEEIRTGLKTGSLLR